MAVVSGIASSRFSGSLTVTTIRFGPARTTVDSSRTRTAVAGGDDATGAEAAGRRRDGRGRGAVTGGAVGATATGVARTSVARPLTRAAITSGPAPNQIRWRSRPSASTRKVSAVWAIA